MALSDLNFFGAGLSSKVADAPDVDAEKITKGKNSNYFENSFEMFRNDGKQSMLIADLVAQLSREPLATEQL